MTIKHAKWLISRRWYYRMRIRKIRRQFGYWDQMLIENLEPTEVCENNMRRLIKKVMWYQKKHSV